HLRPRNSPRRPGRNFAPDSSHRPEGTKQMSITNIVKAVLVFILVGLLALKTCPCTHCPTREPAPIVKPKDPAPDKPKCPDCPWGDADKLTVGGPVSPDGHTEVQCDLPVNQRTKNAGGRDGAGP